MSEPQPAVGASSTARATRVRWTIVGLIFLLAFVLYLLRLNLSVAGDAIMGEMGLTAVQFGIVLGAFEWSYAICQFPGGLFGNRVGGRRAMTWLPITWGIVTLLCGLVPRAYGGGALVALVALFTLRVLLGVVQAPFFPVIAHVIGAWFPRDGRAVPNGLSNSGMTLGAAAAGPVVAWLTLRLGWRASFLVTAPVGIVAAAMWWWWVRDRPTEHPTVNAEELRLIGNDDAGGPAGERGSWRLVLRDRNILLLTISYFCSSYVFYIFFNWFFIYLVQVRKFGVLQSGFVATLPWLVGAVAAFLGGVWCDSLTKRRGIRIGCRTPVIIGLLLLVPLLIAGALASNAVLAITLLSLSFACTQLIDSAYWAAATSVAGRHTAAATGLMNGGGNAVGGVGAVLVPLVAGRFGWIAGLSTGAVFALIGAACWLAIRADEPLRSPGPAPLAAAAQPA